MRPRDPAGVPLGRRAVPSVRRPAGSTGPAGPVGPVGPVGRAGPAALVGIVAAGLLAVSLVLAVAGPAAGRYESRLAGLDPAVEGVRLDVDTGTGRLRLDVGDGHSAVVLGYRDEEYLRVGPDRVERNAASVTAALVAGADLRSLPAGGAQAARWEVVPGVAQASWADLRTGWSAGRPPPNVAADPGHAQRVSAWAVPLMVDGSPVLARGTVDWTGPSWLRRWPLALAGLVLVGLLALAVRLSAGVVRRRNP